MPLSRQNVMHHPEVKQLFENIYEKRVVRSKLGKTFDMSTLEVTVYIDGPLTFATVHDHESMHTWTGWSKFNSNDQNFTQLNGICRAIQRAVDKCIMDCYHEMVLMEGTLPATEGKSNGVQVVYQNPSPTN